MRIHSKVLLDYLYFVDECCTCVNLTFVCHSLETLNLGSNQLSGTIRDIFGQFSDLQILDLSENSFSGSIPTKLFNLQNIRTIALNGNQLDGRIPANYGSAASLETLHVYENALTGPIPNINPGELTALVDFQVQQNRLTGSMASLVCTLRQDGVGALETLWADCSDNASPQLQCDSPACCDLCFPVDLR